jgi:hypothetical protein
MGLLKILSLIGAIVGAIVTYCETNSCVAPYTMPLETQNVQNGAN